MPAPNFNRSLVFEAFLDLSKNSLWILKEYRIIGPSYPVCNRKRNSGSIVSWSLLLVNGKAASISCPLGCTLGAVNCQSGCSFSLVLVLLGFTCCHLYLGVVKHQRNPRPGFILFIYSLCRLCCKVTETLISLYVQAIVYNLKPLKNNP